MLLDNDWAANFYDFALAFLRALTYAAHRNGPRQDSLAYRSAPLAATPNMDYS